jgi:hypothetical protein
MVLKRVLDFISIFALVFILSALVSYLYSLVIHGQGEVDWGTSVRLGIILGLILPWTISRRVKGGGS